MTIKFGGGGGINKPTDIIYLSDSSADTNHSSKIANNLDNASSPTQTYSLQSQTVSANKFDQSLREIDGSVAVANGKKLQDLQINSTKDLGKIFPGFVLKTQDVTHPDISIRGINTTDSYNPSMILYIDGIPQDSTFLAQEFLNVQRVELLRGPQGTIWGQNAQAGVLNIISNPIDSNTPRLNASTSIGSLYKKTAFSFSTPLLKDWLYFGGDLAYSHYSGQIREETAHRKVDISSNLLGTVSIAFAPKNSGFKALFKYSTSQADNNHSNFRLTPESFKTLEVPSNYFIPYLKYDISTYALKLSYDFKQSSISNVASYQDKFQKNSAENYQDGSGTIKYYREKRKTFTDELRLTTQYDNGAYSIFGLYYQNLDFAMFLPFGAPIYQVFEKNALAAFGEGKVPLWWGFDFTLGARYSYDYSKSVNNKSIYEKGTFVPKVALGYDATDSIRLYALYQIGYKSGGFDYWSSKKVNPENSHNFELGIHSEMWNDKISLDISAYYVYTQDKQVYDGSGKMLTLRNTGTAFSKGVELNFAISPIERLRFSFGGAFGQSRYIKGKVGDIDTSGNILSFSPDITMNANLDWEFWNTHEAKFFLGFNGNFYSKTYFDETNKHSQDPYALLDYSVRIQLKNSLNLGFYVQNIFNQKYLHSALTWRNQKRYILGDLRNIGMSLSYKY